MVLDETINNPRRGFDVAALPQAAMFPPDNNSPEDNLSECVPLDENPPDDNLMLALMPLGDDYSQCPQDENLPFLHFNDDDADEDDASDDESFDDMDDDFDDDFDDDDDFEDEDDDYEEDEEDDFDYEEDVDYDDFDE